MVNIEFDYNEGHVTVSGHAQSAPHGRDLVCAAVSALIYTLAANVEQMEAAGLLDSCTLDIRPGDSRICWQPAPYARQMVQARTEAVILGFSCLATAYPAFIKFVCCQG